MYGSTATQTNVDAGISSSEDDVDAANVGSRKIGSWRMEFTILSTTLILLAFSSRSLMVAFVGKGVPETLRATTPLTLIDDNFKIEVSNTYTTSLWEFGSNGHKQEALNVSSDVKFLEPHRATSFSLTKMDDKNLQLEVESPHAALSTTAERITTLYFNRTGRTFVTFKVYRVYDSSRLLVTEYKQDAALKFVRREIRQLRDEDRAAMFSAMEIVYTMPTQDGIQKYGLSFRGIAYFVSEHLKAAASKECDHWHDGAGMVTTHIAFTLEFEQALQVVDETVTLPYWDFTIDDLAYGTNWTQSPIFSDQWFGSIPSSVQGGPILSGRWAYLHLPLMKDVIEADKETMKTSFSNSYGLLRSPWNSNPSPFVTRMLHVIDSTPFTTLPGCAAFESALQLTTLASFNEAMNGVTHGTVHVSTGGMWNVDSEVLNSIGWHAHREQFLLMAKQLWRMGYVRCDQDEHINVENLTDGDKSHSSSACYCPSAYRSESGHRSLDILNATGLLHWLSVYAVDMPKKTGADEIYSKYEEGSQKWDKLLDALCSVGHVGDMFSSASPADPLFWMVHPALDRLLSWRRLLSNMTRPFDETWGYAHNHLTASDTAVVCDWDNVATTLDMPHCSKSQICGGHKREAILPFVIKDQTPFTVGSFYDYMDPKNLDFPYRYDNFDWKHCESKGYSMQ